MHTCAMHVGRSPVKFAVWPSANCRTWAHTRKVPRVKSMPLRLYSMAVNSATEQQMLNRYQSGLSAHTDTLLDQADVVLENFVPCMRGEAALSRFGGDGVALANLVAHLARGSAQASATQRAGCRQVAAHMAQREARPKQGDALRGDRVAIARWTSVPSVRAVGTGGAFTRAMANSAGAALVR